MSIIIIEHNRSKIWALQHSIIGKKISIIGRSLMMIDDIATVCIYSMYVATYMTLCTYSVYYCNS